MSALNKSVLVLNRGYMPVSVTSVKDAITSVYNGNSVFIDTDYILYDWNNWSQLKIALILDTNSNPEGFINMGWYGIQAPLVLLLKKYDKMPLQLVRLTRRNLYIRDGGCCMYTGKKLKTSLMTIDHVIPRCKGGTNTWLNLVISSLLANTRKGGRTPLQAGLKLLKKPTKPKWDPIYITGIRTRPLSWKHFIDTKKWDAVYWDVELKD